MPRVVIVGGGIAGLAAAYDLKRAGVESILFEKRPRLGGVIETQRWEDCRFDCGPDSFLSAKPEALALIKELGLESELIGSNDHQRTTYILRKGRLVELPEGVMMIVPSKIMPIVKSPLLSWATKIRMGLEFFRTPSETSDRSVADFVTDHFGRETLDYLAEPLLSGVYGGDPARLSTASVLPRFLDMETKYGSLTRAVMKSRGKSPGGPLFRSLKNGMGSLVDALASNVNAAHCAVDNMEKVSNGYRVRAGRDSIEAQNVILACPAWSAAAFLQSIDSEIASQLAAIDYTSSVTVTLIYDAATFDGTRAGFGFLVPRRERKRLGAATFVATKFMDRAPQNRIILRCFFGGAADESAIQELDDSLIAIARAELKQILNLNAAPLFHSISRWPRAMAQYNLGHSLRVQQISERARRIPGLHLAGNAYEGIGIPDCIRTGRAAARAILDTPAGCN